MSKKENNTRYGVAEVKATEVTHEGKKFMGYKMKKGNRWVNLKLRRDCENQPKEEGLFNVKFNLADMNEDKNAVYPTYWLSNITAFEPVSSERGIDESIAQDFAINDDELPF